MLIQAFLHQHQIRVSAARTAPLTGTRFSQSVTNGFNEFATVRKYNGELVKIGFEYHAVTHLTRVQAGNGIINL